MEIIGNYKENLKKNKEIIIKRIFYFGKIDYYDIGRKINALEIKMELKYRRSLINWETLKKESNWVFSASGNIWNIRHTGIILGGQILDDPVILKKVKDFPVEKRLLYEEILSIWEKYHLNFRAGTKKQEEMLKLWKERPDKWDYDKDCEYLKSINLYEDRGYKYGTGWLYEPIPSNIINKIKEIIKKGEKI